MTPATISVKATPAVTRILKDLLIVTVFLRQPVALDCQRLLREFKAVLILLELQAQLLLLYIELPALVLDKLLKRGGLRMVAPAHKSTSYKGALRSIMNDP